MREPRAASGLGLPSEKVLHASHIAGLVTKFRRIGPWLALNNGGPWPANVKAILALVVSATADLALGIGLIVAFGL
jgi:hypothetical protein